MAESHQKAMNKLAPETLFENRVLLSFEGKEFWVVKDYDFG